MSTPVLIPLLGEAIGQVEILRWLKAAGDVVIIDEPLIEIGTDKIDLVIPAPASGVLATITAAAGARVNPGTTVATILPR